MYLNQDRLDLALANYEKALSIREANLGTNHVYVADCLYNIGEARLKHAEVEDSIDAYNRALDIYVSNFGEDSEEAVEVREEIEKICASHCTESAERAPPQRSE